MNFGKKTNSNNDVKARRNGDANFLADAIKQIQMNKMIALFQFITILCLIFLAFAIAKQQKIITIINADGESITLRSSNLSSDVLRRQVLFNSREVIENYFDLDYRTAVENRNKLKNIMSASLINSSFGKDNHIIENKTVQDAVVNKFNSNYQWIIMPWISSLNYPHITVFGQIKRTISRDGYKPFEDVKNVKLVFQHLNDRPDPFGRPHDLVLISIDEIDNENTEFKNAINRRR